MKPEQQTGILAARDICKVFTRGAVRHTVLSNVSLTFKQGTSSTITGVSGTGKSTLLHILAGIDTPTSGTVLFNNTDIATFSQQQRQLFFSKGLGLVFQQPHLLGELTVLENVMIKGLVAGDDRAATAEQARALLQRVGLIEQQDMFPSRLSGGQQQRVALARALLYKPLFLLADEPTGNLDRTTGKHIVDVLLELQQQFNIGLVICSHDEYVAQSTDTVLTLSDGHVRELS